MDKKINNGRIELDPVNETHIAALFQIWSCPLTTQYMNIEPFQEMDEARAMIEFFMKVRKEKKTSRYAIVYQNKVIGSCGFNYYDENHRRAEIGYELNKCYWGLGLGTEVVKLLLKYAFEKLQCERIEAKVHPDNIRSYQLLEKLGFILEGRLRKYERMPSGELEDVLLFSIIRENDQ